MKSSESRFGLRTLVYICIILLINCARVSRTQIMEPTCADIYLENSLEPDLVLLPHQYINRTQFEKIQFNGSILNATLHIGQKYQNPSTCQLEICGFSQTKNEWGDCAQFQGITTVPPHTFWDDFEVTYIACSCNPHPRVDCESSICSHTNASYIWKESQCALLFQENGCQGCFFQPFIQEIGRNFNTSNSFQFESVIVRPGCQAMKSYKGAFWWDDYEGYVNITGVMDDANPSFHKYGENFNCTCNFPEKNSKDGKNDNKKSDLSDKLILAGTLLAIIIAIILVLTIICFRKHFVDIINRCRSKHKPSIESSFFSYTDTSSQDIAAATRKLKPTIVNEFGVLAGRTPKFGSIHKPLPQLTQVHTKFITVCQTHNIIRKDAFQITKEDLENPIGKGEFGIVYKGKLILSRRAVAVKKVILQVGHQFLIESFFREIETFQSAGQGHPHIVRFYGACCHLDGLYLLTEYCEGGSLQQYLMNELRPKYLSDVLEIPECTVNPTSPYLSIDSEAEQANADKVKSLEKEDIQQLLSWCEQIASGMQFLASKGIVHVDLAVRNILLTDEGLVKICDLGLSRKCLNKESGARSLISGTFPFNSYAPELIKGELTGAKKVSLYVDIWAYGCTLWEMFTLGDDLYPTAFEPGHQRIYTIRQLILQRYRHPKPDLAPEFVYAIMLECWDERPQNRPNFDNLFAYFNRMRRDMLMSEVEFMIGSSSVSDSS